MLALSGCNNPKEANRRNFSKAIEQHLADKQACLKKDFFQFPKKVDKKWGRDKREQLDHLVDAGLLKNSDSTIAYPRWFSNKTYKAPAIEYSLTATGQKYYDKSWKAFCYGNYQLQDIMSWTEPTQFLGKTISEVKYSYIVINLADWASLPGLSNVYDEIRKAINTGEQPIIGRTTLSLTNEGWVDKF